MKIFRNHKEILRLADAIYNINTIKLPVNIVGADVITTDAKF